MSGEHGSLPVWPQGLKKTKQRLLIWEVLEKSEEPLSAAGVLQLIASQGESLRISTVYRVLKAFLECGMLCKITVDVGEPAIYEPALQEHRHYAVCLSCRKMVPIRNCPLQGVVPQPDESGFTIEGHRFQMYGYCAACGAAHGDDKKETSVF